MATPSERVRKIRKAYDGPTVIGTNGGDVAIESLTVIDDGARSRVEVRVNDAEGGDPDFVIVNPPTLVPDPFGTVIVNGSTFREDPMAAVAHVIAEYGGAQAKQKDTRRGRR